VSIVEIVPEEAVMGEPNLNDAYPSVLANTFS
jgi:hypothetical protein